MVSTPLRATTPPASSTIRTPPAPLHGYSDAWEPYSPRKSARISERTASHTPSPHSETFGSPKTKPKQRTIATPAMSPKKKRAAAFDPSRPISNVLATEHNASTSSTSGMGLFPGRASISASAGMLITPAKTPQKAPSQKARESIQAVARNLFNETEVMPSPKRSRGQKSLLGSFAEEEEEPINIFTDSHERIPEIDRSNENPFIDQPVYTAATPRRSARRQTVAVPGEGHIPIEEAVKRSDGMVIVFRGKKQFRKFASMPDALGTVDDEVGLESQLERPSPKSQIKPRRLLFPTKKATAPVTTDDEEAPTDIEDNDVPSQVENDPTTPMELAEEAPTTPSAPKFAPASPPTTTRTTRFSSKLAETAPIKGKGHKKTRSGNRSPFDVWPRTKTAPETQGQKRGGESLASGSTKRART